MIDLVLVNLVVAGKQGLALAPNAVIVTRTAGHLSLLKGLLPHAIPADLAQEMVPAQTAVMQSPVLLKLVVLISRQAVSPPIRLVMSAQ